MCLLKYDCIVWLIEISFIHVCICHFLLEYKLQSTIFWFSILFYLQCNRKKSRHTQTLTLADFGYPGFISTKTLNYLAFQSFDFEHTWWRLLGASCALNLISTFLLPKLMCCCLYGVYLISPFHQTSPRINNFKFLNVVNDWY